MSRKKQQSIDDAKKVAHTQTNADGGWGRPLLSSKTFASVGISLLLILIIVGAAVANSQPTANGNRSLLSRLFAAATPASSVAAQPAIAATAAPTPQLSKEYLYAGGARLLAVEDAGAVTTASPSADLVVER